MFLDKVTEISTAFNEKVNELNAKVNKFTTDILARITAQDDLIQGNSTNIQRNLELIQGLTGQITEIKDNANKNLNQMLEAIRAEAGTRKTADDALGSRIDQTQQDLAELEQYVQDNPASIADSDTIETKKVIKPDSPVPVQTALMVKLDPIEEVIGTGTNGLKSSISIKKTETEDTTTYQLIGKLGTPVYGSDSIGVPKGLSAEEAKSMYENIYGQTSNPNAPNT